MVNFKEDEQLKTLNHSCAHLMAQAIKHLYPQAKFWVGPVVAEGFYYDVDLGDDVIRGEEDLAAIEKEMKKIAKSGKKIIRKELDGLKVLGNGELTKKLTVKAVKFTGSAKEKIEAHGVPYLAALGLEDLGLEAQ